MPINMMLTGPELPEEGEEGHYFYDTMNRQLYCWLGGWVPVSIDTESVQDYIIQEWL